jgi:hypothetical protein
MNYFLDWQKISKTILGKASISGKKDNIMLFLKSKYSFGTKCPLKILKLKNETWDFRLCEAAFLNYHCWGLVLGRGNFVTKTYFIVETSIKFSGFDTKKNLSLRRVICQMTQKMQAKKGLKCWKILSKNILRNSKSITHCNLTKIPFQITCILLYRVPQIESPIGPQKGLYYCTLA